MKVLHPARDDEWLGVLHLLTMWEMQEIRELCLDNLFQEEGDISSLQLLLHARRFRIRSWFLRATLISSLGLPTVCKIMDMQTRTSLAGIFGFHDDAQDAALVQLDRLCCGKCNESLFDEDRTCSNPQCPEAHNQHAERSSAYVTADSVSMISSNERLSTVGGKSKDEFPARAMFDR
ncbi:hypothetical protein FA13DRAFT_1738923 [Coprinellus micaceus]|uniref:Uncharacterized protein n=1 Tax=Coprinellus micaceus TaxID=71717 RepID=A0A4Y7STE1_COPMI|nr:hypothetical protein FA13DRAFT_1738923 [Coprinellus micaceus]